MTIADQEQIVLPAPTIMRVACTLYEPVSDEVRDVAVGDVKAHKFRGWGGRDCHQVSEERADLGNWDEFSRWVVRGYLLSLLVSTAKNKLDSNIP